MHVCTVTKWFIKNCRTYWLKFITFLQDLTSVQNVLKKHALVEADRTSHQGKLKEIEKSTDGVETHFLFPFFLIRSYRWCSDRSWSIQQNRSLWCRHHCGQGIQPRRAVQWAHGASPEAKASPYGVIGCSTALPWCWGWRSLDSRKRTHRGFK